MVQSRAKYIVILKASAILHKAGTEEGEVKLNAILYLTTYDISREALSYSLYIWKAMKRAELPICHIVCKILKALM